MKPRTPGKPPSPTETWKAVEEEASSEEMDRLLGVSDAELDAELAHAGVTADEVDRAMKAALEDGERRAADVPVRSMPRDVPARSPRRPRRPTMMLAFALVAVLVVVAWLNRRTLEAYFQREPIGPDDSVVPQRPAESAPSASGTGEKREGVPIAPPKPPTGEKPATSGEKVKP